MSKQDDLIGQHPSAPDFFNEWFISNDIVPNVTKCHRALISQLPSDNTFLIDWLADKIIKYHYDGKKLERLKDAYVKIGFPEYAAQNRQIPIADKTRKGNATEIILSEYLNSCQGSQNPIMVYRFRYNPNVDQSMKGDDALIVEILNDEMGNLDLKIFLGEAKFRKIPDKKVLVDIKEALEKDKLPLSYTFLVDRLYENPKTEDLADILNNFIVAEIKAKDNLKYVGLLLSDKNTQNTVERHFTSDNNALVIISMGIDNPNNLISNAFTKATELLSEPNRL